MSFLAVKKQMEIISRNVVEIIPENDLVKKLELRHVVITSVDRDDLPDGGSDIWAQTIHQIKKKNPSMIPPTYNGEEQVSKQYLDGYWEFRQQADQTSDLLDVLKDF